MKDTTGVSPWRLHIPLSSFIPVFLRCSKHDGLLEAVAAFFQKLRHLLSYPFGPLVDN